MANIPDLKQMSNLVGEIYAAALQPNQWQYFLHHLAESFGTDKALLLNVDAAPLAGGLVVTSGLDMEIVSKWEGSKEHEDLWYQALQKVKRDLPYFGDELCTESVVRKSGFYADTLKPLDVEYALGALSVESEARSWIVSIYSSRGAGRFTNEQKAIYQLLIPHLSRAMKIHQQLAQYRAEEVILAETLDRSPFGVVVVTENQRVVWLNRKADKAFLDCDGITVQHGRLSLWDYASQRALDQALRSDAVLDGHGRNNSDWMVAVSRPSRRKPYHLLVCPLSRTLESSLGTESAAWLVLMYDQEEPQLLSEQLICKLYHLSPAEARLCVLLVRTCSLALAIELMHISRNTGKTHLKHIFEKVGVTSQAALVLQLSTGFTQSNIFADVTEVH